MAFTEQLPLLLRQRTEIDGVLKQTENQIAETGDRLDRVNEQMKIVPREIFIYSESEQNRVADDTRTRLLNLKLREQELLAQFPDEQHVGRPGSTRDRNRRAVPARAARQIRRPCPARGERLLSGPRAASLRSDAELVSLRGKQQNIREQLVQIDRHLDDIASSTAELNGLQREILSSESALKLLTAKLDEARISDELNREKVGSVSIIQAASVADPREPVRPLVLLYLVIGALAGLVGAVVMAFLSELLSDNISDPTRVEQLFGVPILAVFNRAGP